jgi:hypothetical protein
MSNRNTADASNSVQKINNVPVYGEWYHRFKDGCELLEDDPCSR